MSDFDTSLALTKRKFLAAFADFPDDEPILINVELGSPENNYDTYNCSAANMSYLCPKCPGHHDEPVMDYEGVLFVKFAKDPK